MFNLIYNLIYASTCAWLAGDIIIPLILLLNDNRQSQCYHTPEHNHMTGLYIMETALSGQTVINVEIHYLVKYICFDKNATRALMSSPR